MSKIRQQRTADHIQQVLSLMVRRDLSDPRLQDITITQVTIDRELEHADIYVNALGDESRQKEVIPALEKAKGFIRRELAQQLSGKTTPNLHFHWDPTLANAEEVRSILDNLNIPPLDPDDPESE